MKVHARGDVTDGGERMASRRARDVWIVEDEPAAAALAADLCAVNGVTPSVFRLPIAFLTALRTCAPPAAVILDWRLEHELSAALFLATRHRYPDIPVIYWTGSPSRNLPAMICDDRRTTIVDKAAGSVSFEAALTWALGAQWHPPRVDHDEREERVAG